MRADDAARECMMCARYYDRLFTLFYLPSHDYDRHDHHDDSRSLRAEVYSVRSARIDECADMRMPSALRWHGAMARDARASAC